MVTTQTREFLFSEIFAVNADNIPVLYAWKPVINTYETKSVGWSMAYRLSAMFGGHWIWAEERLITDLQMSQAKIQEALTALWGQPNNNFDQVVNIQQDTIWYPQTLTIAEFVASGLARDHNKAIRNILKNHNRSINRARIERDHNIRGWDIDGTPAISVTVSSTIMSTIDFPQQVRRLNSDNQNRVLGLFVRDTTSTMKGEIVSVVGRLADHRERLVRLTSRKIMQERIQKAPDDDLVVKIKSGNNKYDYITSVLEIVVRTKDYKRLQIDGQQALKNLQITPDPRFHIVQEIADILADEGYISHQAISNLDVPHLFTSLHNLGVDLSVQLGDGHTCHADARTVLNQLKRHPVYRQSTSLENNTPIKIGVLNFIGDDSRIPKYLNDIRAQLRAIQFDVAFTDAQRPNANSQFEIEQAIDKLVEASPNIIIGFMPGTPTDTDNEAESLYDILKSYMIGRNIQSQFIYEHTLDKSYALSNIILGILAKTGNVPYVLASPLPYADIVAGVDVARVATQRRSGSMSIPAVTRVYTADGDFLRYILSESPVEGETLPRAALRRLFPAELFADKAVLVHRDGPFRGKEMEHLYEWGHEIGSDFRLVEVIKSGAPRLYMNHQGISRPNKGDALILNEQEAILVSSLPPHKNSTPRPLLVRSDGKITIEQALHSILSLTLMHFGSVLQPRLPVTIHYSDRIGYLALRGIKPQNSEGAIPYWI